MSKLSLLKEYVKLALTEARVEGPRPPLTLNGPFKETKEGGDYGIYRDFPIVMTPELMQIMGVTEDELVDGVLTGEHEITIDLGDVYHQKATRGSFHEPPDPEEFAIENFTCVTINRLLLSPEDSRLVHEYIGELTDEEQSKIRDSWEPPSRDYDDFDRGDY